MRDHRARVTDWDLGGGLVKAYSFRLVAVKYSLSSAHRVDLAAAIFNMKGLRVRRVTVSLSGRAFWPVGIVAEYDLLRESSAHEGLPMQTIPIVHFEAASTLAVVVSSNEPLLFLSDDLKVIAASASFCRAFDIDPKTVCGQRLSEIGNGEWAMPKLASLLTATASGSAIIEAYEIDFQRPNQKTRHLVVNARTLDDGDIDHIRLLLAITDVTDVRAEARLKDDLVRDNAICCRRSSTGSQTASRSLPAFSCRAPGGSSRRKRAVIFTTPITGLCRSRPCSANSPCPTVARLNSVTISLSFAKASARR